MEGETRYLAATVFEAANYSATDEEINALAANMEVLELRGLSKLNQRLLQGGRKVWDTFTEHNFASKMARHHAPEVPILYEPPDGLRRPPDFKIEIGGTIYWVQIKSLSNPERENRQARIVAGIRDAAKAIEIGKFFGVELAGDFAEGDVLALVEAVAQKATMPGDSSHNPFPPAGTTRATFDGWQPNKTTLSHLTLVLTCITQRNNS